MLDFTYYWWTFHAEMGCCHLTRRNETLLDFWDYTQTLLCMRNLVICKNSNCVRLQLLYFVVWLLKFHPMAWQWHWNKTETVQLHYIAFLLQSSISSELQNLHYYVQQIAWDRNIPSEIKLNIRAKMQVSLKCTMTLK